MSDLILLGGIIGIFVAIFLMLTAGAFSGLLIVSQLSPIAQTASFGITAATAAVLVSIYSVCNASGRFVWGAVSDRIGYVKATMVMYGVVALSLLVLLTVQSQLGDTTDVHRRRQHSRRSFQRAPAILL